ncbi:MAG: hypothetical protein MJZ37_07175 [Bacilli bacterium]|nr:hypothetical protein [Bacilli bacterium]
MQIIESILKEIFKDKETAVKTRLLGGTMNETYIITSEGKDYVLYLPQGNAKEAKGNL